MIANTMMTAKRVIPSSNPNNRTHIHTVRNSTTSMIANLVKHPRAVISFLSIFLFLVRKVCKWPPTIMPGFKFGNHVCFNIPRILRRSFPTNNKTVCIR